MMNVTQISAETNSKFYYLNSCDQDNRLFNYSLNISKL